MPSGILSYLQTVPLRGVLTVAGGFLVHSTISTGYIFGNMNPYLTSYLRARSESFNIAYSDTIWISTASYIAYALSMPLFGFVERLLQPRFCTLIGGLIFNSALLLTYFTLQHSLALTTLTYGVLNGAAKGLAYPTAVKSALKWFPKRAGLVTGIIICGIGFGTFVFNQVITYYINPDNLSPDEEVGDNLFFTQESLLDRVPFCFLMLGGIYTGVQLIAVFGLMSTPPAVTPKNDDVTTLEECAGEMLATTSEEKSTVCAVDSNSIAAEAVSHDFTPRQVLKTKIFYLLWIINVCTALGIFFVSNFYKTFSQTFIKDDHFLALAGSVGSACNALGRPVWGAVGDKIGFRETLVIVIGIFGTAGVTFNLCEYGGKPMLMIWLCLLYGTFSGYYCVLPSLQVSVFGQKYYSVNMGLIYTSQVVVQLVGSLLTSQLKSTIGWQGILYIGAGSIIFSFLLATGVLIKYRRDRRKSRKHSKKYATATDNINLQESLHPKCV